MENNELIAKFMGFPIKTEVTVYNYGMDFRSSYDKEIIYSNIKPNLKVFEEKFGTQIVDTFNNYFDSDNQEDNFEYKSFLSYDTSWNSLINVFLKIEELGNNWLISDNQIQISYNNHNNYQQNIVNIFKGNSINNYKDTFDGMYKAIIEFIKWYNEKQLKYAN